jgi:hypothetical protein
LLFRSRIVVDGDSRLSQFGIVQRH